MTTSIPSPPPWGSLCSPLTGILESRAGPGFWFPPCKFERDNENLYALVGTGHCVKAGDGCLEGFLALHAADAEAITAYAARWGSLNLCAHNLPFVHDAERQKIRCVRCAECKLRLVRGPLPFVDAQMARTWKGKACAPKEMPLYYLVVPFAAWRSLSKQLGAILGLAAKVHERKIDKRQDWKTIDGIDAVFGSGLERSDLAGRVTGGAPLLIKVLLDAFIDVSGLRIRLDWSSRARVFLQAESLFDALIFQVMMAVANIDGFALCGNCGALHKRTRKARSDREAFCLRCRADGIPARRASARYRDKKKNEAGQPQARTGNKRKRLSR